MNDDATFEDGHLALSLHQSMEVTLLNDVFTITLESGGGYVNSVTQLFLPVPQAQELAKLIQRAAPAGCVCDSSEWDNPLEPPAICSNFEPSHYDTEICTHCEHERWCHCTLESETKGN